MNDRRVGSVRSNATSAVRNADLTQTHFPVLDGLRGLAILLVMFYHFSLPHTRFHGHEAGWLLQLAQAGWLGVDLFFVLSGFLITGILAQTRAHPHYFRNFLGRRFLRIWPLYYLSLLLLLVVMPLILPSTPTQLQSMQEKQWWFWLYGANWLFALEKGFSQTSGGYFWSLAVEEQFYVVWPLVVYLLGDRGLLRVSLGLLAVSLLSRVVLVKMGVSAGTLYVMTFTHLDGLAVGSCLAVCMRSPALVLRLTQWMPILALVAVGGLLGVRIADGNAFFWSRQMATFGYTFAAVLFGALVFWVLVGRNTYGISHLLVTPFMRQCGKYSYALYLVHVPLAAVLFPLVRRALEGLESSIGYDGVFFFCMTASFVASWITAILSWRLFEAPVLSLKRYFSYGAAGDSQVTAVSDRSSGNRPHG